MKLLSDLSASGKKVFVRADLDVNVEQLTVDGSQLTEVARLQNLKPTVDWLLEHGAKQIIIAGHIGRPEKVDSGLSTKHLLPALENILEKKVVFKKDFEEVEGEIILFENLRFWKGEKKNDPDFSQKLAGLVDVYINEAFGNCHRAHASMVGITSFLPFAAGIHLQKEIEELSGLLEKPKKPFVAVVGGAKIETKVPVIENLSKVADKVFVGGKIASEIKISDLKDEILNSPKVVLATAIDGGKDINPESIRKFGSLVSSAKTIVWNGPMGYFEGGYDEGTAAVAKAIIESGAYSVVGGGETTEFLASKDLLSKFSFVSSGGGAMLYFLSGRDLPGVKALED